MKQAKQESSPYESVLPKQYVKALRKVQQHILDNPTTFNMDTWGDVEASEKNTCHTVGCICGWMAILTTPKATLKPILGFEERTVKADIACLEATTTDSYAEWCGKYDRLVSQRKERCIPTLTSFVNSYRLEIPSEFARDFDKLFSLLRWPSRFRQIDEDTGRWTTTTKKAVRRIDYFLQHGR